MPFSRNLNTYHDVERVLATARKHGGLLYELQSPGKATHFRARVYYYRSLLMNAARDRAGNPPGFIPTTEWDDVIIDTSDNFCILKFGEVEGKMTTLTGEKVDAETVVRDSGASERILKTAVERIPEPEVDDLTATALRLIQEKSE